MQFEALALMILMVGVLICLAILVKSALRASSIPPLIGYIALGFAVRILDVPLGFLTPEIWNSFSFLSTLGIITVLFRVGLESNIAGLIRQLPRASVVWLANVLMSAALGYLAARYLLNLSVIPSMFVATALTATSMSISVVIWQEAGTIHTPLGELLIDVAELDDISGVVLIAMIIMQHGRKLGPWAVAQDVFSGMALVTAFTCLFSPLIIRGISLRWPVYGQGHD